MAQTVYKSENVFTEAFSVFNSMRDTSENVDIVVRGDTDGVCDGADDGIPCHKLVLSAMSPYFRAMFRSDGPQVHDVTIHGVDRDTLNTIINYCYTGRKDYNGNNVAITYDGNKCYQCLLIFSGVLELTLDTICSVVSASDLLLLDWVLDTCQQFLLDNLHMDNVVTAGRVASVYRWGDNNTTCKS